MSDKTEAGTKFEREVANLYRMLGYGVTPNIDFEGFQLDIVARRRVPGADETKLMIECKYKESGTVSNEELSKLSNTFTEAGRQKGFHKAVLVTNSGFSQKARTFAAERAHLVLKTIKELEEETLDIFSAFGRYKREYQQTTIHSFYIPSRGAGRLPGTAPETKNFENVEQELITWIDSGPPGFLTIMADFGVGKTTLLERVKYYYCDLYERGASTKKPMLFKLKDLHKYKDIDDYLAAAVAAEFRSATDTRLIWPLIDSGGFVLLLDGFDEVAMQVDTKQRRAFFVTLSALFNTPSHSLMTCRPTFFINSHEYDDLIDEFVADRKARNHGSSKQLQPYRSPDTRLLTEELRRTYHKGRSIHRIRGLNTARLDLLPFSEPQINSYLAQRDDEFRSAVSSDWSEVKRFLYSATHIQVLMWRPILLDMITRTVLSGHIDVKNVNQRLSATDIYESYLQSLLEEEYDKKETRRLVSPSARQSLLEIVAVALYTDDAPDISFDGVVRSLEKYINQLISRHPELKQLKLDQVAADIILTGFLSRDIDDKFKFSHKSFMEFLIARFIVKHIMRGQFDQLSNDMRLSSEIIYFIGSFLMFDQDLFNRITRRLRSTDGDAEGHWRTNLGRALVASEVPLDGFALSNLRVDDVDAQEVNWKSVDIENVTFDVRKLNKVRLYDSTIRASRFANAIREIVIEGDSEFDIQFDGSIENLRLVNSFGSIRSVKSVEIKLALFNGVSCRFDTPVYANGVRKRINHGEDGDHRRCSDKAK
jgi:hypothetical protein